MDFRSLQYSWPIGLVPGPLVLLEQCGARPSFFLFCSNGRMSVCRVVLQDSVLRLGARVTEGTAVVEAWGWGVGTAVVEVWTVDGGRCAVFFSFV